MRRLASAAACGMLLLAACSEQPQSPTEQSIPSAAEPALASCRPVKFPTPTINSLINQVFPPGANRLEALARAAAVALLWDACKVEAARKSAVNFVQWIDLRAPSSANPAKVAALKAAILNAVGIPVTAPPPGFSDDFGAGIFDPTSTTETLIKTKSGRALVQLDPGSFNELTVITLSRKADDFQLTNFDGNQFPPKYDYDAVNASGNKILQNGKTAIVAFCLLGLDDVKFPGGYPEHPRIGHNPVAGAPGFPFEVLEEVNLAAEGLDDDLSAEVCGYTPVTGFRGGPAGFANTIFRTAKDLLLPEPLFATAIMGTLPPPPPIGGRAGSLSPFGVVELTRTLGFHTERGLTFDPVGQSLFVGTLDVLRWWQTGTFDGFPFGVWVYPAVQVLDASGNAQLDVPVHVSLVPVGESPGALTGTLTESTVASGLTGVPAAFFDNLRISLPGVYRLRFTTPGAAPIQSGEFTVGLGPVSIPDNFGSSNWSYKQISSFDAFPSTWWTITPTPATGWTVGTAPFGTSGPCALPAPVTPWTQATTMLLRRDILINSNVSSITLEIRVDGDVFAAVNGWGIDGGGVFGVTCGSPTVQFTIPASETGVATAEAPLLPGQVNKIFIRGVDDEIAAGSQSYLDARITVNTPPPIN